MKDTGYIKLHRAIQGNPLYLSEPFTKTMAWIDLILNAKYEEEEVVFRGRTIQLERGQLVTSLGLLASRWQWTRCKVQRFLYYLENEGAIKLPKRTTENAIQNGVQKRVQSAIHLTTVVSIVNYEKYQANDTKLSTKCDTATIKENKKIRNIKRDNNTHAPACEPSPIENRQKRFYDSLVPFVDQYGKSMVRDFYDYWSEPDRAKTPKMRFEKQPTWSLPLRLATWKRHEEEYGNGRGGKQKVDTNDVNSLWDR